MEFAKEKFDSEQFSIYAQNQASKYLPQCMSDFDRKLILETFKEFALRSANVLSQDMSLNLDNNEKIIARARHILEWIFKVSVALAEANIPVECRHGFMLDIGYITFEISKEVSAISGITNEQAHATIEYRIMCRIKQMLDEFEANGIITNSMKADFLNSSYIDKSKKNIEFAIYNQG